jgi:hypothetical protein
MTPTESPAALLPARWYVVTNYGAATLCLDEADARKVARQCDRDWPKNAPHVAVQLVPAASESRGSVPDGWKLVPIEPTDEMLLAEDLAFPPEDDESAFAYGKAMWAAFLAAAPSAPDSDAAMAVSDEYRDSPQGQQFAAENGIAF